MKRVDHIDIVKICGSSLIGKIDRVLQREIPDRECFKFCITGIHSALVLVIELAETCCHLPAAGARSGDNYQATTGFNVFVAAKSFLGNNEGDVGGIIRYNVMAIDSNAENPKTLNKLICRRLLAVMGNNNAANVKPDSAESVNKPQCVLIIGNPKITAPLGALDVIG